MNSSHLKGKGMFWRRSIILFFFLFLGIHLPAFLQCGETEPAREESQFKIYVAGKEVGKEKFTILTSSTAINSNSILELQEPGNKGRKVKMETELTADSRFLPQSYTLKTDINGQREMIVATFSPGQAMFEIKGSGTGKRGLLTGDQYSILDSNIFHHFIFIVRAFDFEKKKSQSFEVVVPQEVDSGVLNVSNLGIDRVLLRGKGQDLIHLRADSGQLTIDLWVDSQRILHKISIPSKKIEVVRIN
jgi:hypothetical protein